MILYVAGPYTAKTEELKITNVLFARDCAVELWKSGHYVICPHTNTRNFESYGLTWEHAMKGYMTILSRCDAVVMLPRWKKSKGAKLEHALAKKLKFPIYYWPDFPLEV